MFAMDGTVMQCRRCSSLDVVKNGINKTGKQKYKCKDCDYQFVMNPKKSPIPDSTKDLIDRLLLEKISLAGIARVTMVSERWLQQYVNDKYQRVPRQAVITEKSKKRLTIECDEMWSFVGKRKNKQWVWLAIDRDTREVVGVHVGNRDAFGAQALWKSLPPIYRQCAVSYTDYWHAYSAVFPSTRHQSVGKDTGHTNHIERLNGTIRQRISRLVRKTLSFSKK
jgi:IS1 family transposase/transposase-like protein